MSFASRLSKRSKISDMVDDAGSSPQVAQIEGPADTSPQSGTDGGADSTGQNDTSISSAPNPQLQRMVGHNASSGTRYGAGSPAQKQLPAKKRMSFGQRLAQKSTPQTEEGKKKQDASHLKKEAKVNRG